MADNSHGKMCGLCKKWIRAGKVEQHMLKCAEKHEKKNKRK